jgi:hypothetical protein
MIKSESAIIEALFLAGQPVEGETVSLVLLLRRAQETA